MVESTVVEEDEGSACVGCGEPVQPGDSHDEDVAVCRDCHSPGVRVSGARVDWVR